MPTLLINHNPLDPGVDVLDVGDEGLLVVPPVPGEGGGGGVLAARQLQGDLHAVGRHIIVVLRVAK